MPTKYFRARAGNPRATSQARDTKEAEEALRGRNFAKFNHQRVNTLSAKVACQRNCFPVMFRPNLVAAVGFRANYCLDYRAGVNQRDCILQNRTESSPGLNCTSVPSVINRHMRTLSH